MPGWKPPGSKRKSGGHEHESVPRPDAAPVPRSVLVPAGRARPRLGLLCRARDGLVAGAQDPRAGSASAFLVAFTVGSAAIWMPCILQMVLVFCGLTAAGAQRFRGGRFFAAYIGTYAALGLVAARIRRGRGAAGGDRRGPGCRRGGDGLRRPVPSRRTPQPGHAGLRAAPWAS